MTPLRKSLERLVEVPPGESMAEYHGAAMESARLAPVIAALLELVDAATRLEISGTPSRGLVASGFHECNEALTALRKLVGE